MSSYTVLARKYRPQSFSDLVGQEVLVKTITHAINRGKISHAFMLTGTRGIGKTSTARIIAKALNCEKTDAPNTEPCGECNSCIAISTANHPDVLEFDAASHTGVSDIRNIIDNINYLPTVGRYKIYIIDEVHMLSNSAFNAMLKSIEEPPEHIVWIMATTEIRKIPITILSRCQNFSLKRMNTQTLKKHLLDITHKENFTIADEALSALVEAADGSVRDSLSLLDQIMNFATDNHITYENAVEMLGLVDRDAIHSLLQALIKGDTVTALSIFADLYNNGAEEIEILSELLSAVNITSKIKINKDAADHEGITNSLKDKYKELSECAIMSVLDRIYCATLSLITTHKLYTPPYSAYEMLIIRITHAANLPSLSDVEQKLTNMLCNQSQAAEQQPNTMPIEGSQSSIPQSQTQPSHANQQKLPPNIQHLKDQLNQYTEIDNSAITKVKS